MKEEICITTKNMGAQLISLSTKGDILALRVSDASNDIEIRLDITAVEILHDAIQRYFGDYIAKMDFPVRLAYGLGRRFDWTHFPT